MANKLYKLALWYIKKCNNNRDKRSFKNELNSLERLTYWNFGKYMLAYGADAEWSIFSRYEVLDNAIQRLAEYENGVEEIRAKAIDEFAEKMKNVNLTNAFVLYCADEIDLEEFMGLASDEIAKEMKGE